MFTVDVWMEVAGWAGSAMVVLAYAMLSMNKWKSSDVIYQMMNLAGSTLLIVFTVYKRAFPPATVNTIWAVIALFSLIQMATNEKNKTS
jgi:hypothetical protein